MNLVQRIGIALTIAGAAGCAGSPRWEEPPEGSLLVLEKTQVEKAPKAEQELIVKETPASKLLGKAVVPAVQEPEATGLLVRENKGSQLLGAPKYEAQKETPKVEPQYQNLPVSIVYKFDSTATISLFDGVCEKVGANTGHKRIQMAYEIGGKDLMVTSQDVSDYAKKNGIDKISYKPTDQTDVSYEAMVTVESSQAKRLDDIIKAGDTATRIYVTSFAEHKIGKAEVDKIANYNK